MSWWCPTTNPYLFYSIDIVHIEIYYLNILYIYVFATLQRKILLDFSILFVHGCSKKYDTTGSVSVPIFQSATFTQPGIGLGGKTNVQFDEIIERQVPTLKI